MKPFTLVITLILNAHQALSLLSNDNFYYFPGRGCGTSTEIKYFDHMPEDTEGLKCAFVKKFPDIVKKATTTGKICIMMNDIANKSMISFSVGLCQGLNFDLRQYTPYYK